MEDLNDRELNDWVESQTSLLDPPRNWEPNMRAERARFEDRVRARATRRRRMLISALAFIPIGIFILRFPQITAHAAPQESGWSRMFNVGLRLWYWVREPRPLRLKLDALRSEPLALGQPQEVSSQSEAVARVGFDPYFFYTEGTPGTRVPGESHPWSKYRPRFSVFAATTIDTVVNGTHIQIQLAPAVIMNLGSPRNGEISDSGKARWDEVTIVQTPTPHVAGPAGFDLTAFATAALQAERLSPLCTGNLASADRHEPERVKDGASVEFCGSDVLH